jgi:DNA polymerase-3 subunit gamma/tau
MSYTALYRKFRPSTFDDVKGQDHVVKTLKNEIANNRIAHAYIFSGTRGTGKTSVAKVFAKAVNCEHPVDGNPCNECAMCKAINSGKSLNVVEMDAASNNSVDNIRDLVEDVKYAPSEGRYRVYIIDEAHMLTTEALNALLKTLEEPPEYVMFILATTEIHKILPTILSRCQRFDFRRIDNKVITARIEEITDKENVRIEPAAAEYIARTADGSMRDALSLLDEVVAYYLGQDISYENTLKVLGAVDNAVYEELFRAVAASDVPECMRILRETMDNGREAGIFVSEFIWHLRNILLIKEAGKASGIVDASEEAKKHLEEEAGLTDSDTIMNYIKTLSALINDMKYSIEKRVLMEICFIKLMKPQMLPADNIENISQRLKSLESQVEGILNTP